jgi:hypothetical protein
MAGGGIVNTSVVAPLAGSNVPTAVHGTFFGRYALVCTKSHVPENSYV